MVSLAWWIEQERSWGRAVCERLGVDPARVVSLTVIGRSVLVEVFDGPFPENRHTESFTLPDSA